MRSRSGAITRRHAGTGGGWAALAGGWGRVLDSIPPAAGAAVMGTGIVSIGLTLDGYEMLSRILLVITSLMWVTLAVLVSLRSRRDAERLLRDIQTPSALTLIAGTAVLGTRLALLGWTWAGSAALVATAVSWALLSRQVLRHWTTPTVGASLMLTVSTESLAVLTATLGLLQRSEWLIAVALVPFALGLCFYVFVIARFDRRQLAVGHGDQWITGGALAISTLAAGKILAGTEALPTLGGGSGLLRLVTLGLWALTMLWLPVLLATDLLRPRLSYDVRRWATVFPVGMYAVCSFVVGAAGQVEAITSFARLWIWVAFAVWGVVFVAMIRRGVDRETANAERATRDA
ncbi:MAG: tellurite resistance/C4-dicarboxylate transporter family protein [Solirubrobacteraceae bacterium]